jgi:hypothetical protein
VLFTGQMLVGNSRIIEGSLRYGRAVEETHLISSVQRRYLDNYKVAKIINHEMKRSWIRNSIQLVYYRLKIEDRKLK